MEFINKVFYRDSREMSELNDESLNLVVTSPPYWNLKDYENDSQIGLNSESYNSYIEDLNQVWSECIRVLKPDGKICINIMPILLSGKQTKFERRVTKTVMTDIEAFMMDTGKMYMHSLFIWDKRKIARFSSFGSYPYPTNMFSTYPYEWIMVFAKEGKREAVSQDIKERSKLTNEEWQNWAVNSIWEMQPAKAKLEGHPAPFPKELPYRLIKLFSFVGDTVLDPFMGTGTTAEAAIELERNFIGYEINENYQYLIEKKIKKAKNMGSQMTLL